MFRTHPTPIGNLPSVTAILSATKSKEAEDKLRKWQHKFDKINGVGASEIYSEEAKTKGTLIHKIIEMLLENKPISPEYNYPEIVKARGFLQTITPIKIEQQIYHPSGYSGILDCIGYLDGQITLLDWKTSKRLKRKSWITDYFLQTTAYAQAWNYLFPNLYCNNIIVVVLGPKLQLFECDTEEYLQQWNERLSAFNCCFR